jgi:hypothetical protein
MVKSNPQKIMAQGSDGRFLNELKKEAEGVALGLTIPRPPRLDAVSTGLVTSRALSGGNLTGLSALLPDLVGKCREQLKQTVRC